MAFATAFALTQLDGTEASAGAAAVAYLVGSVPFGLVIGRRLHGVDLRERGSRNLGATNAYRVLGARAGLLVSALDLAKGLGPVVAAGLLGLGRPAEIAAGAAAVVGHIFPLYLRFRGGKGVATSAGALAGLAPLATAIAAAVWIATVAVTRYVSLASMLAAVALPLAILLLPSVGVGGGAGGGPDGPLGAVAIAVEVLVIVRHRANVRRLVRGTEPKVGARQTAKTVGPPKLLETTQQGRGVA